MKQLLYKFLASILVTSLFLTSCDEIEPFEDGTYIVKPKTDDQDEYKESIVVFEFTGWACIGCPTGHETLKLLDESYKERIHTLAIHAGYFAEPGNEGPDFRSSLSNSLYNHFNQPNQFPIGAINSLRHEKLTAPGAWSQQTEAAYNMIKDNYAARIECAQSIDADKIKATIKIEFTKELKGKYNIGIFVTESNIIGFQKDEKKGLIHNYEHNHVLRSSMTNGLSGYPLTTDPAKGAVITQSFEGEIDFEWNPDNLELVIILLNADNQDLVPVKIKYIKNK